MLSRVSFDRLVVIRPVLRTMIWVNWIHLWIAAVSVWWLLLWINWKNRKHREISRKKTQVWINEYKLNRKLVNRSLPWIHRASITMKITRFVQCIAVNRNTISTFEKHNQRKTQLITQRSSKWKMFLLFFSFFFFSHLEWPEFPSFV